MNPTKLTKEKGIALILVLGVIFVLGVIVGSFAFFSSNANKTTKQYANYLSAQNYADAGYQYMTGAIQDYFNIVIPMITADRFENNVSSIEFPITVNGQEVNSIAELLSLYPNKTLEEVLNEANIEIPNETKITSNDFNNIQAALTHFLNGKTVSFTQTAYDQVFAGCSSDLRSQLDLRIFSDSDGNWDNDPNTPNEPSWAKKYGFIRPGQVAGQTTYDIDLDGINNYKDVPQIQEEYAESVMEGETAAKGFTDSHVDDEIRDANWHVIKDDSDKIIGRFAVMARDQSSLINLRTDLGKESLSQLASQTGMSADDLSVFVSVGNNLGLETIQSVLQSGENVKQSYTTASIDATNSLDVNSVGFKDFYIYLNENLRADGTAGNDTASTLSKMRVSAKIAANLEDYTDVDNIPTKLTCHAWNTDETTQLTPWDAKDGSGAIAGSLGQDEIFLGTEGIRISEVMISPEQAFYFESTGSSDQLDGGKDNNCLRIKLHREADSLVPATRDYYYPLAWTSLSGSQLGFVSQGSVMKEELRNPLWDREVASFSGGTPEAAQYTLTIGSSSGTNGGINIANPGGAYQLWLKMKITAKNNLKANVSPITNTSAVTVAWHSTGGNGSEDDIKKCSTVTNVDASTGLSGNPLDYIGSTWEEFFNAYKDDPVFETLLIISDPTSDLQTIQNSKMNFPKLPTAAQPAVSLTWNSITGKTSTSGKDIPTLINEKYNAPAEYPFGTRVVEVAVFDKGAGTADRDELIGVFYCVNTNGFSESANHLVSAGGDSTVPDVDKEYLWFYSVGVPPWTKWDELPEWLQARTLQYSNWNDPQPALYPNTADYQENIYNPNLCVFPRENCNLEFRFRLVDTADARFNGGAKVGYTPSLDRILFDYNGSTVDAQPGTEEWKEAIKKQLSIVGRPQWAEGDEVEIEIKEMVATQQLYKTSVSEDMGYYKDSVYNNVKKYIPVTYNTINDSDPVMLNWTPPLIHKNPDGTDMTDSDTTYVFSLNETLYYRNQRLERANRAANELHGCEYVEIFNGTGQEVDMSGWVMKVEQYKAVRDASGQPTSYVLLGPEKPDGFFNAPTNSFDSRDNYLATAFQGATGRPDYILLNKTVIPSGSNEQRGKLPFGLVTNGLNHLDDERWNYLTYGETFYPYMFENSSMIAMESALPRLATTTSGDGESGSNNYVYLDTNKTLAYERRTIDDEKRYYVSVDNTTGIQGNMTWPLRKNAYSSTPTDSNYMPWYATDTIYSYMEQARYNYETFNLVAGVFQSINGSPHCNAVYVDRSDQSYHLHVNYSLLHSMSYDILADSLEYFIGQLISSSVVNPFTSLRNNNNYNGNGTNPDLGFDQEEDLWNTLSAQLITDYNGQTPEDILNALYATPYNVSNSYPDGIVALLDSYLKLMLPYYSETDWEDIKIHGKQVFICPNQWKYDALTFNEKINLMKTIWGDTVSNVNKKILCEFMPLPSTPNSPGYSLPKPNPDPSVPPVTVPAYGATGWDAGFGRTQFKPFFPFDNNWNGVTGENGLISLIKNDLPLDDPLFPDGKINSCGLKPLYNDAVTFTSPVIEGGPYEERNFYPNGFAESPISGSGDFTSVEDPADIPNRIWMFVPVRFYAVRAPGKVMQLYNMAPFNVNVATASNYSDNDLNLIQTYNIPMQADIRSSSYFYGNSDWSYNPFKSSMGINPLHFRDDADRIVITLFAPNGDKKITPDLIYDMAEIYNTQHTSKTYGDGQYQYDLVDEWEWLTRYDTTSSTLRDKVPSESYDVVDRAVIDRDVIETVWKNKYTAYQDGDADWWGNKSVALNTFFTDPLLLRRVQPGSVTVSDPFQGSVTLAASAKDPATVGTASEASASTTDLEAIAEGSACYWEPHLKVYKVKPGPLGAVKNNVPSYVLTAFSSPGQPNFRMNHFDDQQGISPDTHTNPNVDITQCNLTTVPDLSTIFPVTNSEDALGQREAAAMDLQGTYTNFSGDSRTYKLYDRSHSHNGVDTYSHRLLPYRSTGLYIKNSALVSISELCDIPAPYIEATRIGQDPLDPNCVVNAFVDGLETNIQYFTEDQKRKVFSNTSADSTVLCPGTMTNWVIPDPVGAGFIGEDLALSNPISFQLGGTLNSTTWGLSYHFNTGESSSVQKNLFSGRYRIFVSGLNSTENSQVWDAIQAIVVIPDAHLFSTSVSGINADLIKNAGGSFLADEDAGPGIGILDDSSNPITVLPDDMIQLLPLSGGEYFNIQGYLEINFISNPSSTSLAGFSTDTATALKQVTDSMHFKKIKIHLIPQGSLGKININTAPLPILLRVNGFSEAVNPLANAVTRVAAKEVISGILQAQAVNKVFVDAGDLLVYAANPGGADYVAQERLFPVNADYVDPAYSTAEIDREILAREKLKIFRNALPYIQFAGSSFEIVSLGQALKPEEEGDELKLKVLASSKLTATVNLKTLLKQISGKFVYDPWNVGISTEEAEPEPTTANP